MSWLAPTTWIQQPEYPKITSGDNSGINLQDLYKAPYNLLDIFSVLPKVDSFYNLDSPITEIRQLRLESFSINKLHSGDWALIAFTYAAGEGGISQPDNDKQFFLSSNLLEKPLEKSVNKSGVSNYLVNWNYDLYQYVDPTTSSVPAWWATATTRADATGKESDGEYLWSQDNPGGKWEKIKDRTKPGVDTFPVPSATVVERTFYRSKNSVNQAAATIKTIEAPENTFGKSGGQWCVMSVDVSPEGRRYLVERRFVYADTWDSDLYPT